MAESFLDNPEPDKFNIVNHKDGNKSNYDLNNLEWIDYSGNILHAMDHHLNMNFGETHKNSKLTNSDAIKIKNSNKTGKYLSTLYNVSQATISLIKNGKRYNT